MFLSERSKRNISAGECVIFRIFETVHVATPHVEGEGSPFRESHAGSGASAAGCREEERFFPYGRRLTEIFAEEAWARGCRSARCGPEEQSQFTRSGHCDEDGVFNIGKDQAIVSVAPSLPHETQTT
jgi:hypothetical protein